MKSISPCSLRVSNQPIHYIILLRLNLLYLQSTWIIPSRLREYYRPKHLIHLYFHRASGFSSAALSSQGQYCIARLKLERRVEPGKVKVSQTGKAVWSQTDNSVSLHSYKEKRRSVLHAPEQSPETQTKSGREWGRDKGEREWKHEGDRIK